MAADRLLRGISVLLLTGLIASIPVFAQKITGDISGTVTDASGAAVSGALVRAENTGTGEKQSATTNETGFFRIVNLNPGQYRLTAEAAGFKTMQRQASVDIALTTQANFSLQIGAKTETVEVQDVAPLVESTEDRLSTLFVGREVQDLPNNGGDFNNLLDGVPGVQRSPGGGFQSLNINGQRATSNNFAVDGIPNNDRYYGESSLGQAAIAGTAAALIPLDGISEFNVQSNPGVEFGVKGGSVINIGLKSGTNEIHGNFFWDRHTDAFDARNWFASSVTPFRLNQFGGSGGFPIKKDKAFVYMSYQGFHLKDVFPSTVNLPAQAEINDALACVATGINPNSAGDPNPATCINDGVPGPGPDQIVGTADDGMPSTIGSNLLSFVPLAPSPGAPVNIAANNALDLNNFHVKFDYIFNQKHRVSVKYLFGDSVNNQPAAPGVPQSTGPLATNANMWNSVAPTRAQLAGVNYNWTISPTKVLESRFGYQRFSQRIGINNTIDPEALGLNTGPLGAGPNDKENFEVPTLYGYSFGNTAYGFVGGVQGYPIVTRPDASYDWQEHFTMIKGNHTIKVGGQYQDAYTKSRRDRAHSALYFYYLGNYLDQGLVGDQTNFNGESGRVTALNELLLGFASGAARSFGVTDRHLFQKSVGLYVQDSWKVKPNFTLEAGVRWDVAGALGERDNIGANFLPDSPKADVNGFVPLSAQPLYNVDKNNFGPRIGFAWDVRKNGKTVVRAGYSLNYDLANFGTIAAPQTYFNMWSGTRSGFFTQFSNGISAVSISSSPSTYTDTGGIFETNSFCQSYVCMAPGVNIYGPLATAPPPYTFDAAPGPYNVVQLVRNFQSPMNHAFNLTIEQELSNKTAFSIAYVGTKGRDLVNWRDLNACAVSGVPCGDPGNPKPFDSRFPDTTGAPLYNHVLQLNNDGYSNYNSLQIAYKVRDIHGLTGQVNYTWSRAFDTGSANRGGTFLSDYQNPYNVSKGYAPSDFDTPWNINFTVVYDVPKIHGIPKLIGEGWSINSLFRAQDGRPFTVYERGDPSNQGLRETYLDNTGAPLNYHYHVSDQQQTFFNTSAFAPPADGTIGNSGRNSVRQPGIAQLDVGIFKSFKFRERYAVKFKWDVFNVLNHAMFAYETGNFDSSGFGKYFATPDVGLGFNPVLGTGAQRNMQFGLSVDF
jgi:outer membrane receptor protein involved in Fe transport